MRKLNLHAVGVYALQAVIYALLVFWLYSVGARILKLMFT